MQNTSRKIEGPESQATVTSARSLESSIIPASFMLGGMKIDVMFDVNLAKDKRVIGEASYNSQQIVLDPSVAPLQTLEQSFLHELVHWIFFILNESELRNNEKLVDLFAHFLYQARVTEQRPLAAAEATAAEQGG